MKTNKYAAEMRIAHERNSDSIHGDHVTEGARDIKDIGEHLTTEEPDLVLGKHAEKSRVWVYMRDIRSNEGEKA